MNGDESKKLDQVIEKLARNEGKLDGLRDDVQDIKKQMVSTVTRSECGDHVREMNEGLRALGAEFRKTVIEMRRSPTGSTHQTVSTAGMAAPLPNTAERYISSEDLDAQVRRINEANADRRRRMIGWILGSAVAIITLLGFVGTVAWKVVTTLQGVQDSVQRQQQPVKDKDTLDFNRAILQKLLAQEDRREAARLAAAKAAPGYVPEPRPPRPKPPIRAAKAPSKTATP